MLTVDIKKRLGRFSLELAFETEGEVLGLLGASGAGKSMALKCIAGLERPDSGRIMLSGRTLFDSAAGIDLPPQKRRVGYLFQQYALFPNMTVRQNVAAGCREWGEKKRAAVEEKLDALRLAQLADSFPSELSGGEAQRAALARILINEPELLLLDEPFSALDSFLRRQLESELGETIKNYGRGAVFVSHSRDEIAGLCDSVCVLDRGRGDAKLKASALFCSPGTLAACLISGCENIVPVQSISGRLFCGDWGMPLTLCGTVSGDTSHVGIHARHVKLSAEGGEPNSVPCRIVDIQNEPFSRLARLAPEPGRGSHICALLPEGCGLSPGARIYAVLPPERLMPLKQ